MASTWDTRADSARRPRLEDRASFGRAAFRASGRFARRADMNTRQAAAVLSLLFLALSGCAQQQPSAFETALPKLRDQCVAGDNQACQKIAEGACLNGTPETCRAQCWPAIVAQACAPYRPEEMRRASPGPGLGPGTFGPGPGPGNFGPGLGSGNF